MINAQPPNSDRHHASSPLRTTAIVIYATLGLLVAAIPQSLANWLREMRGSAVQERLLLGAETLQSLSERAGLAAPYRRGRELFLMIGGHEGN
jgi:hypothetical protein